MKNSYKNKLFEYLKSSPICIDDFNLTTYEKKDAFGKLINENTIKYKNSNLRFSIIDVATNFDLFKWKYKVYSAGYKWTPDSNPVDIKSVIEALQSWINYHVIPYKTEESTPDLWQNYLSMKNAIPNIEEGLTDFKNFSVDEKKFIDFAIKDFRNLIVVNFNPGPAELQIINQKLDYLIVAVDRLNKTDWKNIIINVVISISIALSLGPEQGKILWHWLEQLLSNIPQLP